MREVRVFTDKQLKRNACDLQLGSWRRDEHASEDWFFLTDGPTRTLIGEVRVNRVYRTAELSFSRALEGYTLRSPDVWIYGEETDSDIEAHVRVLCEGHFQQEKKMFALRTRVEAARFAKLTDEEKGFLTLLGNLSASGLKGPLAVETAYQNRKAHNLPLLSKEDLTTTASSGLPLWLQYLAKAGGGHFREALPEMVDAWTDECPCCSEEATPCQYDFAYPEHKLSHSAVVWLKATLKGRSAK